jgi:hypothetical protein
MVQQEGWVVWVIPNFCETHFGELDNPYEPWLRVCGSQVDACVTGCPTTRLSTDDWQSTWRIVNTHTHTYTPQVFSPQLEMTNKSCWLLKIWTDGWKHFDLIRGYAQTRTSNDAVKTTQNEFGWTNALLITFYPINLASLKTHDVGGGGQS